MSTFGYLKPGLGNVGSYQVSGVPFITSSVAPALDVTSAVVNFPRVTNYIVIKNINETEVGLRVSFNRDSVVDNTNYILLAKGESFSAELKTTDVHLMSDSVDDTVRFSVVAGLTNIDRREMTQTTPVPPNLLAWVQKQKLFSSGDTDPAGDAFGVSVKISQDAEVIVIGSHFDEENGGTNAGSVYIFQSGSSGYQQVQKLTASGDADPAGDRFGYSVTMNAIGNLVAVGSYYDEENGGTQAGSVYIFESGSSGYQQVQKLTASGDASPAGDRFGHNVSLNSVGNILAIGSYFDEENGGTQAGSVYIFESGSSGYQQVQKLTASGDASPAGDLFGFSVDMNSDGEIIAVGTYLDEENGTGAGSVYIFQSGSSGYQQVQKLTASGDADPANDYFGQLICLNSAGDILIASAIGDEENGGTNAGSVYIFQSGSSGYQQVQKLTASGDADPAGDSFGYKITINSSGDVLAVGSWSDEENGGTNAGSVYIFQSGSSGYQQVQKLTASGDADPAGDQLGLGVSLNSTGNVLIASVPIDEENGGATAGAAYVFKYTRDY